MPNDHSARTRKQKLNSTHYSLDCSSISMHLTTSLFFVSKILCLERGATTARGISERVLRDDKRRADDVVLVIHSRATEKPQGELVDGDSRLAVLKDAVFRLELFGVEHAE